MTLTMRWNHFLCLGVAAYLAIAGLRTGADMLQLAPVIWGFLAFGVGGQPFADWLAKK